MNYLKSLLFTANLCLLTNAVHAEGITQETLQKVIESIEASNLSSGVSTLLEEKELEQYYHPHGSCGRDGGARGPAGPMGPPGIGLTGPTGPTGPAGAAGSTAIIPYASGGSMDLNFYPSLEGLQVGAALGFGRFFAVLIEDGQIDLNELFHTDCAFSIPEDGTITSLSASFSTSNNIDLEEYEVTITAQLYWSIAPNTIFEPIPATAVTLGSLTGNVVAGTFFSGIASNLNIPVTAQTRLLVVYAITSNAVSPAYIGGIARAGLGIN